MIIRGKFKVSSPTEVFFTVQGSSSISTDSKEEKFFIYHTKNGQDWCLTESKNIAPIANITDDKATPDYKGFYDAFFPSLLEGKDGLASASVDFDFTDCPDAFLKAGPFAEYAKTKDEATLKAILSKELSASPHMDINLKRLETTYNRNHLFAGAKNLAGKILHKDSIGVAQLINHFTHASNTHEGLTILLGRIAKFVNDHINKSKTLFENEALLIKTLNETNDHIAVRELAAQLRHVSVSKDPAMKQSYVTARSEVIKAIKDFDGNKVGLIDYVLEQADAQMKLSCPSSAMRP